MANYIETARSNYFKVKDREAFELAIEPFGGLEIVEGEGGRIAILYDEGYNDMGWDDDGNELTKTFDKIIAEHLTEDSVFVVVASGYEKMRYVSGYAFAVDCTGTIISISLDDIYAQAEKAFEGKEVTLAQS